jgi:hypothetical protein
VRPGAILVVEAEELTGGTDAPARIALARRTQPLLLEEPFACVDLLGRTPVERMIDRFLSEDMAAVTVLVSSELCDVTSILQKFDFDEVDCQVVDEVWFAANEVLRKYAASGIDRVVIATAGAYVECDLQDLFRFNREKGAGITRVFDGKGPLDFWVAPTAITQDGLQARQLLEAQTDRTAKSSYFVKGYVNRLAHARDVRQCVADMLRGRCQAHPSGREMRPGVWFDDGAQVHKRARIVGPAYIGRGSQIREDTLVTRCSNVESFSCIDYGTVIEDSSVLTNSYVGIWLDVSHAVVRGNKLLNLGRDIVVEFSDSSVLRDYSPAPRVARREGLVHTSLTPLAYAPSE